jgi:uncharacterized membrane protein HdeD (DUF308 family)
MSKPEPRRPRRARGRRPAARHTALEFTRKNYVILGSGLLSIVVGYILLSRGSISAAPVLLVAGYCVLIPLGILVRRTRGE